IPRTPMSLTRRTFLHHCALALSANWPGLAHAAQPPAKTVANTMLTRVIPSAPDTEQLPVIGMGTWNTFDVGALAEERAPLVEVLKVFYESGARLIDSSPMYGEAERTTGDLVHQLGKQAATFLASKV